MSRYRGAVAAAALIVLAGGCSSGGPATAPGGAPASSGGSATRSGSQSAPADAGTTPTATATRSAPAQLESLADRYLAIAVPANHRLDDEVGGFARHQRHDLAAAEADLRAEATTERWFDRHLAEIPFPPAIVAMARAMIQVNQARAALADREARSASLGRLHSFAAQHRAADAAVEFGVRLIRQALGLPPPSES